jgi:hypothetical protein
MEGIMLQTSVPKLKPSPTLFDRISAERAEIRGELTKLRRRLGGVPLEATRQSFAQIHQRLRAHQEAVEQTLHLTLLEEEDSNLIHEQVVLEREYHHLGELVAAELHAISPADPRWKAKLSLFIEILGRQLSRSSEFLRSWRRELGTEEVKLLSRRFDRKRLDSIRPQSNAV